jgi:dihydrofolate reductase
VQGLTDLHLVDEYRLMVFPTALGVGRTLFGKLKEPANLTLTDMRQFGSDGVVLLTYTPATRS